jgi:serine/threonine-protein kinase
MITLQGQQQTFSFNEQTDLITKGKFNKVFKGVDGNNNPIFIKQLLPHLAEDQQAIIYFKQEYIFQLHHPNIIAATDYIVDDGKHYLVRPWIDGNDLSKTAHKLNEKEALFIVVEVLQALTYLHQKGILHLDIQPKNILMGKDGKVYLTDFGLAKRINHAIYKQPFNMYYSSPEQILNHVDLFNTSTDLFAVGVLLYELLLGDRPFTDENPEVLMNIVIAAPIPVSGLSKIAAEVIEKATAKPRFNLPPTKYTYDELDEQLIEAQKLRYQTAEEFLNAIKKLEGQKLVTRRWWKFWEY